MKRLQVYVEEKYLGHFRHMAKRRKEAVAVLIREAMREYFERRYRK